MRQLVLVVGMALAVAGCGDGGGGSGGAASTAPKVEAVQTFEGLSITVPAGPTYTQCAWELNGDYRLLAHHDLEPGNVVIPLFAFADDAGRRFANVGEKLRSLEIDCDGTPRTFVYLTW